MSPSDTRRSVGAILSASSGNLVEWYDFYAYAFTSIYFAQAFFPAGDETSRLLSTAAIFAVGFFMRPLGGWLFGFIADKYGRRQSMVASVLLMCGGSLLIALLPTHAAIGAWAPVLLLFARLAQGLSVGGEYGTAATYMSEVAVSTRRGFFSSFQYVTLIGGQLLAVFVLALLQSALSKTELEAWGWRIPFAVGACGAFVALMLRQSLHETATATAHKNAGSLRSLLQHRRALLLVLGLTAGGSLYFYTFTTYMQKYLVSTVKLDAKVVSTIMTVALVVFMVVQPVFGALSDRIGRKNNVLLFSGFATLTAAPLLLALPSVTNVYAVFALVFMALIIAAPYTAVSGIVKAELFPAEVRALGVGLPYAIANALFGGSAEYVALSFKQAGHESWFALYVTVLCGVSLLAAWRMPDSRTHGTLDLTRDVKLG